MKNFITILLLIVSFSCKQNKEEVNKRESSSEITKIDETRIDTNFKIEELDNVDLIGMQLNKNSRETDIYKKYAVDFTAACYSSDLCVLEISQKNVKITNC